MFGLLFFLTSCLISINGHGYLLGPVARSTAWLVDPSFRECCSYPDHMGMYCGDLQTQWNVNVRLDSNPDSEATQECLDRGLLTIDGTDSTKFRDVGQYGTQPTSIRVQLPSDVVCQHCVFQWKYTTGNNWGTDPITGQSGIGMSVENETFMGSSDISIMGDGTSVVTPPPVVIPTNSKTVSKASPVTWALWQSQG